MFELYFKILHDFPSCVSATQKRQVRRDLRYVHDLMSTSARENWRYALAPDGNGFTKYHIIPDHGQSDEEMREFCENLTLCAPGSYSAGQLLFTAYITWKRVPCGIAIIHTQRLDV